MEQDRILVVEDEKSVATFVKLELEHEGYQVDVATDGENAITRFEENEDYSCILLDWMLPKLDGLEVCRRIRKKSSVPIIMLTAREQVGDKIAGLDRGADDYLTKPFEIEELLARIRAIMRRSIPSSEQESEDRLHIHDMTVMLKSRRATRAGYDIELTQREFDLLTFLIKHKNEALSREWLLSAVWGYDFAGETNVVDVYIRYLRNKIDRDFEPKLITTVRGIGYMLYY
ncbi:response regulator transcription factor [Pontibacillus salipaludis]|uniref:DNA-binding response regulator n=1 Tax=Pontibacillus salipaludis TaxID=1697394 RepID=A0ABQ1QB19_9BACI|nr:response regulator transcription factor [Pontibacillus salipaludis]GGD20828.1 DNA-binding response regulator [Pontibacillus salipaludis]